MQTQVWWENDCRLIVACAGEIEWDTTEVLIKSVKDALGTRSAPQVVLDLERVDFITSAGIGGLLQLRKLILERQGFLVIASASATIAQLLRTVGLDRHVPMMETLDAARGLLATTR